MKKANPFSSLATKIIIPVLLSVLLVFSVIMLINPPDTKVIGDVDCDSIVSQADIDFILSVAAVSQKLDDKKLLKRADINSDGIITAADAREASKHINYSVSVIEGAMPETSTAPLINNQFTATDAVNGEAIPVADSQSGYSVINNAKMYIYPDMSQVMQIKDSFVIVTFGWGHGVGMSQQGAIGLARAGYSYIQILQHYFTNVVIMQEQYPPTVRCAGKDVDTVEMLARIVQMEIAGCTNKNSSLDLNALRAQAVAAYTNMKYSNYSVSGCSYVSSYSKCRDDVKMIAQEIAGQYMLYKGNVVYAYYSACSGGVAATYEQIWGNTNQDLSYLTNCASYYDCYTSDYVTATAYSPAAIKEYITNYDPSIVLSDDPSEWIKILVHDDAVNENIGYVSAMQIGDRTIDQGAGLKFRDKIMKYDIKSPCFAIIYNGKYL